MLNDDRLREALEEEGGGAGPDAVLRDLRRKFERRWKKNRIYYSCFNCGGLLMALWGAQVVNVGASIQSQFQGLVPFLFGVSMLILTQLWWAVTENRIAVLQVVKELQLQVAALDERLATQAGEKGGADA